MNNLRKAITLLGLSMLVTEYLEDLMDDPQFNPVFVREMKRDSKAFLKSSKKFVDRVAEGGNPRVNEQIHEIYMAISRLVENHIEWEKDEEPSEEVAK